jgi:hypothetical protein
MSGYDGDSTEFSVLDQFGGVTIPRPVQSRIVYNDTLDVTSVDLGADTYCDVQGNRVFGTAILQPFESKILISAQYDLPALP